jgi:TRAP-type uncharacterized transport system substrate-binding protein
MKWKSIYLRLLILSSLATLVITVGFPREGFAQKKYWKIGTAGSGGTFYFVGL